MYSYFKFHLCIWMYQIESFILLSSLLFFGCISIGFISSSVGGQWILSTLLSCIEMYGWWGFIFPQTTKQVGLYWLILKYKHTLFYNTLFMNFLKTLNMHGFNNFFASKLILFPWTLWSPLKYKATAALYKLEKKWKK